MTSTLDRRSLLLSWVLECVYMPSLCSRIDLIATRPKALVCAYFLNGSSAYNYWVSRMPPHNRIRAMPIGHREDSTGETMTQVAAGSGGEGGLGQSGPRRGREKSSICLS